ncbi:MAG: helix-turn-helix transcriptional regulator [Bacteroidota bacterium]
MGFPVYEIGADAFSVQRMEDIYDRQAGVPDAAHRHAYYTVIWSMEARGTHTIDFRTFEFGPHQVYFVSPGQIHQVVHPERPRGIVITFNKDFLLANAISPRFISDLYLFREYGEAPPLELDPQASAELEQILEQMLAFIDRPIRFKAQALGSLLRLFLICCYDFCPLDPPAPETDHATGVTLLRNFREQLEQSFQDQHQVGWYAQEVHVSADYLNRTIRQLTGRTAKEHIQGRILLEARRLLLYTDASVKEIAYELGFDESTHFSAFFKRGTGQRPSAFRKQ